MSGDYPVRKRVDGRVIGGHKAEEQIQVTEVMKDVWRSGCECAASPTC